MDPALKRLLNLLFLDRKLAIRGIILQILQAVTFIPFTAAVGWFVDEVILKERGWMWVVGYAVANLLLWPIHMWFTVKAFACTQMMVRSTVARLRRMTVDQLQSLSMSFFTRQGAGALSNKVTVDINRLEIFMNSVTSNTLVGVSVGIGTLVYLFWLNTILAVLSVILVPLQVLIVKLMRAKLKKLNEKVQQSGEGFAEKMVEFVAGMRLTKSFGNEDIVGTRLIEAIEHLKVSGYDASIATRWLMMLLQMVGQYMPVVVWCIGAIFYWNGWVTMGELVAFIGLLTFVQSGMNAIIMAYEQWLPARPGLEAVVEILDCDELDAFDSPLVPPAVWGNIKFQGVSFRYPETDVDVLKDINLVIPQGQKIGLVGETGAGKSTFLDMVMAFYRPDDGRILWDDRELDEIGVLNLRRSTAIMGQEAFIWNDTVRENIRFGRATADDADVIEAARKAQADRFIEELDRGYDTVCGERGSKLSGGQRQRLSMARIFLRDPSIVVLDEPTSALDAETEARLQVDLDHMCTGRTTFIVAHRLVTLKSVDRVLVFEGGKIVEDGPIPELLKNPDGHFSRLYALQNLS